MLGDTININNLCCNPGVLKKAGKTSQNYFFGPNFHRKWVILGHDQDGKNFEGGEKQQKQIVSFQKIFILSKYHML